jgi:hypothetical protein
MGSAIGVPAVTLGLITRASNVTTGSKITAEEFYQIGIAEEITAREYLTISKG